jgi:hypothetical protein
VLPRRARGSTHPTRGPTCGSNCAAVASYSCRHSSISASSCAPTAGAWLALAAAATAAHPAPAWPLGTMMVHIGTHEYAQMNHEPLSNSTVLSLNSLKNQAFSHIKVLI